MSEYDFSFAIGIFILLLDLFLGLILSLPLNYSLFVSEFKLQLLQMIDNLQSIQSAFDNQHRPFANPKADSCAMNSILSAIFSLPNFVVEFIGHLPRNGDDFRVSEVESILLFCIKLNYDALLVSDNRCDLSAYTRCLVDISKLSIQNSKDQETRSYKGTYEDAVEFFAFVYESCTFLRKNKLPLSTQSECYTCLR